MKVLHPEIKGWEIVSRMRQTRRKYSPWDTPRDYEDYISILTNWEYVYIEQNVSEAGVGEYWYEMGTYPRGKKAG